MVRLTLNAEKTKFMVFSTIQTRHRYRNIFFAMGGKSLERVDNYKYLGVYLDEALTFSNHIDYLYNLSVYKLKMIGRTRDFIDTNTALLLYKSLILPIYHYCDVVYNSMGEENKQRMQRLQQSTSQTGTPGTNTRHAPSTRSGTSRCQARPTYLNASVQRGE